MRTWICIFQGHEYSRIYTNNLGVGWDFGTLGLESKYTKIF